MLLYCLNFDAVASFINEPNCYRIDVPLAE